MNKESLLFLWCLVVFVLFPASSQNPVNRQWPEEIPSSTEVSSFDRLLIDAMHKKVSGELGQAAILLNDCLDMNPRAAAAYYELSDVYLMANDNINMLINARLAVRNALEQNVWYDLQLAKAYQINNIPDSAIYMYQRMLQVLPGEFDLWLNLAQLYAGKKNYRKALLSLRRTEKKFGPSDEIYLTRYQIFYDQNKFKSAEKELKTALQANPMEPKYYGLLAELKSEMGDEASAITYYQKLMELDPENDIGFLSMIEFYKNNGRIDKAFEESEKMLYSKSIDLDIKVDLFLNLSEDSVFFQNNISSFNHLSSILYDLAPDDYRVRIIDVDRNIREHNLKAAADDLIFIISKNKINYFMWEQLFFILNTNKDFERLFEVSHEAIKLFPAKYLPYFFRGASGIELKKYQEASEALSEGINLVTEDKETLINFYVLLGEAYHQLKEYSKCDSVFEQALQMDDSLLVVLNNYSYYLSLRGERLEKAESLINQCLLLEPNNPTYLDTKGWVLYKMQRLSEARTIMEKTIQLGGEDNEEIMSHYIQILMSIGDRNKAIQEVIKLLNIKKETLSPEEKLKEISEKWGQ